ncbi:hypothetical protein [Cyanobium sp. Morenito 9A2]|uniref:hypothetical protein n=1 Tax=Cyanobium sp. Morenito 9A2 TaxID=2823718 RepID=UPI0020CB9838|nr:hypothetical protein [Cyanobium sp. Morenito 9A2]MCP9849109.1 hypothetical protein [Cyanobium sp. Morenito 9A2]
MTPSEPTLQSAWNLYKAHWQAYVLTQLVILGLAIGFGLITALTTMLAQVLTGGMVESSGAGWADGVQALLNFPFQIVYQVLVSLLGVLIVAFPAIYYATGQHPDFAGGLALLRANFWRYLLAGLLASVVTGIGFLACLVPGMIVAIITPIFIRRVFTSAEPIWPAFLASFRDLFNSGYGWGLVGYELLAGLLVLISALFCLVPLIVTGPLAAIFIQQYLVSRRLGEPSEA